MTMHVRNQNDNVDIVRDRYGAAENPNQGKIRVSTGFIVRVFILNDIVPMLG